MSDLHDLCRFPERPITQKYTESLKFYLSSGIPATYTIEEAYNYTHGIEEEPASTTTPLHIIATHVPENAAAEEVAIVQEMVATLLEYGAGWSLTDVNNDTPGCILIKRGMKDSGLFDQVVDAGVRAELLLRKVSEFDMEVISDDEVEHPQDGGADREGAGDDLQPECEETVSELQRVLERVDAAEIVEHEIAGNETKNVQTLPEKESKIPLQPPQNQEHTPAADTADTADNQQAYLAAALEYKDGALVTKENQDGVMMEWETDLMRLGCESLFKTAQNGEAHVLNIGFGMGIIDSMIQARNPAKHYICEAHPDVLANMRKNGWFEKPNVVVLEGRWQDNLDDLLSSGEVYFDGIYYDTFSETYEDMLELFNYVVGLLKPTGVFSFFNGLGADRQVIYEVYRKLVEIDLATYGLSCDYTDVAVPEETMKKGDNSVWDGVRRSYWNCPTFYHPEAKFMDI